MIPEPVVTVFATVAATAHRQSPAVRSIPHVSSETAAAVAARI
jgi:hypothetical protein